MNRRQFVAGALGLLTAGHGTAVAVGAKPNDRVLQNGIEIQWVDPWVPGSSWSMTYPPEITKEAVLKMFDEMAGRLRPMAMRDNR